MPFICLLGQLMSALYNVEIFILPLWSDLLYRLNRMCDVTCHSRGSYMCIASGEKKALIVLLLYKHYKLLPVWNHRHLCCVTWNHRFVLTSRLHACFPLCNVLYRQKGTFCSIMVPPLLGRILHIMILETTYMYVVSNIYGEIQTWVLDDIHHLLVPV